MESILPQLIDRQYMVVSSLSEEEANLLVSMAKQLKNPVLQWFFRPSCNTSSYLVSDMVCEDETELTLHVWRGDIGKKRYSFALLTKDKIPIKRWDDKIGDMDPVTKETTKGPHKHFWDENYQCTRWYHTNDVRSNDPDGAVLDFMKECHIETKGILFQKEVAEVNA